MFFFHFSVHPGCLKFSESLAQRALSMPWQCNNCKKCAVCQNNVSSFFCLHLQALFYVLSRVCQNKVISFFFISLSVKITQVQFFFFLFVSKCQNKVSLVFTIMIVFLLFSFTISNLVICFLDILRICRLLK